MKEINDTFFSLFTEKNSDMTRKLRLKGSELFQRIGKRLDASNMYALCYYLLSHPCIKYVDLSYNNIGDEGLRILSKAYFSNQNTLLELNLLHCDISPKGLEVFANSEYLYLKKLTITITGNKFGPEGAIHVGTFVQHCRCLECLDISDTDQTYDSLEYLLMIFEDSNLQEINLSRMVQKSYYSYHDVPSLVENLSVYLQRNQTLTKLHLEKCSFDGHDVEVLLIGLKCLYLNNMKEINDTFFSLFTEKNSDMTRKLRLKGSELFQRIGKRLDASNMYALSYYLLSHPCIKYVDLSYNNIGDEGLRILSKAYFSNQNTLLELNLLHCDISPKGLEVFANSEYLYLKKLRLTGNKFGPEGAIHVGTFVQHCRCLECLDISDTDQTYDSLEYLLMIFEDSNLQEINVSRMIQKSYYSYHDVPSLVENLSVYLQRNQTLTELHLEKCSFDGHDVEVLLIGLKAHPALLMLNLAANKIGSFGTEILAKWLKTRPNLIALKISSNSITTPGALALSLCLPFSKIRYLDIQRNKITDEGLANLLNTIKKPTAMRQLFMWGNELGFMTLQRIERMLESSVLNQEFIDVRIYYVDGVRCAALYRTDHFKCKFYSARTYGFPPELRIKRNLTYTEHSRPRALIDLNWIDRHPPVTCNDPKPKDKKHKHVCMKK